MKFIYTHFYIDKAVDFFTSIDLHCPINYNPADFYIKQLAIIPADEEICKKKINVINLKKKCEKLIFLKTFHFLFKEICDKFESWNSIGTKNILCSKTNAVDEMNISTYKASWFRQLWCLISREFKSVKRNPAVTTTRINLTLVM